MPTEPDTWVVDAHTAHHPRSQRPNSVTWSLFLSWLHEQGVDPTVTRIVERTRFDGAPCLRVLEYERPRRIVDGTMCALRPAFLLPIRTPMPPEVVPAVLAAA